MWRRKKCRESGQTTAPLWSFTVVYLISPLAWSSRSELSRIWNVTVRMMCQLASHSVPQEAPVWSSSIFTPNLTWYLVSIFASLNSFIHSPLLLLTGQSLPACEWSLWGRPVTGLSLCLESRRRVSPLEFFSADLTVKLKPNQRLFLPLPDTSVSTSTGAHYRRIQIGHCSFTCQKNQMNLVLRTLQEALRWQLKPSWNNSYDVAKNFINTYKLRFQNK